MLFSIQDQVIVVTGANGFLGSYLATALLEQGARVALIDLQFSAALLTKLKNEFQDRFLAIETSVTRKEDLRRALEVIKKKWGAPQGLLNMAGLDFPPAASPQRSMKYEDVSEDEWDAVTDVNMKGVHFCCQVFGGEMARAEGGAIINVGSLYGLVSPDQNLYKTKKNAGVEFYKPVAYSASKSALYAFTKYLAFYWASKKVRVNILTPGGIFNHQDEEFVQNFSERVPMKRMGNKEELLGSVIFLLSKASSYVTGANLVVDGGWLAI